MIRQMKYVCRNCNFRFERDVDMSPIKCPYCGRIEAIRELSAEDLIKEEN